MTRAEAPPRRQSSTALFFILIAACESATPSHNDLGRRYSNHAAWDTVRLINPADSGWTRFRYLDADSSNIVGYDHITRRLYAYNLLTGRPAWSVRQSGLQAFSHPIDVEIDNRGYAWLLDTRDKTVSSFDPAGKLAITNPVPGVARDVLPLNRNVLIIAVFDQVIWEMDRGGQVISSTPFPFPISLFTQRKQVIASMASDGQRWAAVIPFGSHHFVFNGTKMVCMGELREGSRRLSEPVKDDPPAAVAVAAGDSTYTVLAGGSSTLRQRVVDEFRLADCTYIASFALPTKAVNIVASRNTLLLGIEQPTPQVMQIVLRR